MPGFFIYAKGHDPFFEFFPNRASSPQLVWCFPWHPLVSDKARRSMLNNPTQYFFCNLRGNKSAKTRDTPLVIDSHPIEAVAQHKHLGMIFTPDLKWTTHIQAVIRNASKRAGLLRWMSHHLRGPLTTQLYLSYVRPTMEYAIPLWHGSIREEDALQLERIETAVARCVLQAPWLTPKSELLQALDWPSLRWRREIASLCLLHRFLSPTRAIDKLVLPTTLCLLSQSAIPEEAKATDSPCSPDNETHHLFLLFIYLFLFYLLIFEGFPNRVLVYPDRGGLQIMLMICTNKLCQCWWMWVSAKEKLDVESAKGKGAWELLSKGLTPKLWRDLAHQFHGTLSPHTFKT